MSTNYVAIILGASSGFGRAIALRLASEGYHIVGVHLDRAATLELAEQTKAEIEAYGRRALFFNVNASDPKNRAMVLEQTKELIAELGSPGVHVMVHSLAFGALRPFVADTVGEALNQKQIEMTMDVMANSLIYWAQDIHFGGLWSKNGGRIFGLTSAGSHRVLPHYGAVSAAKAAMESYIRQLALEFAPYGILANTIRAGVTDTPAMRKIPGSNHIVQNAYMRNPSHTLTKPEDVANAVALLVKEDARWINGTIIGVDGGEDSVDLTWWTPDNNAE